MVNTFGSTVAQLSNPIRLSGTPARYSLPPPSLGADDHAVLQWLDGLS
jgi:crotonobetainyl-CoA:carnitine CoA-transferase CaiB-like acyl-CoA transferase